MANASREPRKSGTDECPLKFLLRGWDAGEVAMSKHGCSKRYLARCGAQGQARVRLYGECRGVAR